jgi:hypothetical protein
MDSNPVKARTVAAFRPALDRALSVVLLALWTVDAVRSHWDEWAPDLSAVYIAGWLWRTGEAALLYAAPDGFFGGMAASWQPAVEAIGIPPDVSVYPFVYPPLWAVLVAPLTGSLDLQGFSNLVALIQTPMLAASVLLAARLLKPASMPLMVWTLAGLGVLVFSLQAQVALWHHQPTITVSFLILLSFVCLDARRPVAAGAALALAAAIKLTPAALALVFLIDRQYRALLAFALIGGALGLLSLLLAGIPPHAAFLESLGAIRGTALLSVVNTSLSPALLTFGSVLGLGAPFDPTSPMAILRQIPGWLPTALTAAGALILLAFLAALRGRPARIRRAVGLLAVTITTALFGPLGWIHYYLMPLLLLPGLFGVMPRAIAALCVTAVALISLSPLFEHLEWLPWPVANYLWLSVTVWLCVLAALYLSARRTG